MGNAHLSDKSEHYFFFPSVACAKACVRGLRAFAEGKPEGLKKLLIPIPLLKKAPFHNHIKHCKLVFSMCGWECLCF